MVQTATGSIKVSKSSIEKIALWLIPFLIGWGVSAEVRLQLQADKVAENTETIKARAALITEVQGMQKDLQYLRRDMDQLVVEIRRLAGNP